MPSLSYTLFLGTLIFAPLAFGSVETWSIGLVEILVFLTSLTYFFETRHKSKVFLKVPGISALFLLLCFMWLQLIPLPPSVVNFIAPAIYQAYVPILEIQNNHQQWIPLTVNQKSTLLEALRITSYVFFYILTVQLLSRKELLNKTVKIVAGLAITIAFFAILQKFTSPDLIFWFRSAANATPFGPWVNRNHYAGFMGLLFPLALTLFFYYRPNLSNQRSFRARAVAIFSSPGSNIHFFLGFSVVLILSSIVIGLSRGGIIATNLALFFFLILLTKKSIHYGKTSFLVLFGGVLLAVTWFGWEPILTRFNASITETGSIVFVRWHLWKDCVPLIKDFLLTGSGFGTFIHIFPQYNTLPTSLIFHHAHNDYIELLTNGGLIGFLLVAWFVITIVYNGFKSLSKRREQYSVLLIIGGLTSIFSLLVHSITDFNMHNGANGLYFFFLCGVLISAGNTRIHFRISPTLLRKTRPIWKLTYLAGVPLLLLTITIQGGILRAEQHHQQASTIYLSPRLSPKILQEQLILIDKAIRFDPLEMTYSSHKGDLLSFLNENDAALSSYLQASRKDPLKGSNLQKIGLSLPKTRLSPDDRRVQQGVRQGTTCFCPSRMASAAERTSTCNSILTASCYTIPSHQQEPSTILSGLSFHQRRNCQSSPSQGIFMDYPWQISGKIRPNRRK
jgi:O-antigen ligase